MAPLPASGRRLRGARCHRGSAPALFHRPALAALILALGVLGGAPAHAARLAVSDTADPGVVGDAALSLSEAIRLATGDLDPSALSSAEQAQVTGGAPGAAASDTIVFALSGVVTLAGTGTAEVLPPLDAGGDTLDGEGRVTLRAVVDPAGVLFGLRIASGGNVVRGLAFEDVPGSVLLVSPAVPGDAITGNRILDNRFTGAGAEGVRLIGTGLPTLGATVVGGAVDDTLIEGNVFESGTPDHLVRGAGTAAINLFAAYAPGPGSITGAAITNTTIRQNLVRDIFYGVYARAAAGSGTLAGSTIAGLVLDENTFERVTDGCLVAAPSHVEGTGTSTDSVLRDVAVTRNLFSGRAPGAPPYWGGAVFVSGGFLASCFDTTGTPTSARDHTTNVTITGNRIVDRAPYGIFLHGAHSCGGAGGTLADSRFESVLVEGNEVESSGTGISLQGASTVGTGSSLTSTHNVLRDVAVRDNVFRANASTGVEVLGVYSANGSARAGATVENTLAEVTVEGNVLADNTHGVSVIGAIGATPAEEVARNAIRGLRVVGNQITGCAVAGMLLQAVNAAADRGVADNRVEGLEITDNLITASRGAAILAMAEFIGPGGRARDNAIVSPLVARNTIQDLTPGGPGLPPGTAIMLVGGNGNYVSTVEIADNRIERITGFGIALGREHGHTIARNSVFDYGRRAFQGRKRWNTLVDNVFGPRPRRRRRRPAAAVMIPSVPAPLATRGAPGA